MKITNFLFDVAHARQYGTDCLVKLNDDIVYVTDATRRRNQFHFFYHPLPQDIHMLEPAERTFTLENDVDFNPGSFGFVNIVDEDEAETSPYVYRGIRRSYKLGVSLRSIIIDNHACGGVAAVGLYTLLKSEGFVSSMRGQFPSVEEALDRVDGRRMYSVALSKNFAVNLRGELFSSHNRREPIGKFKGINNSQTICKLNKEYFYLQQLAEKDGIRCEL